MFGIWIGLLREKLYHYKNNSGSSVVGLTPGTMWKGSKIVGN